MRGARGRGLHWTPLANWTHASLWKGMGEAAPSHLGEIVTTERSPVTGNVVSVFKRGRRRTRLRLVSLTLVPKNVMEHVFVEAASMVGEVGGRIQHGFARAKMCLPNLLEMWETTMFVVGSYDETWALKVGDEQSQS